MSIYDADATDLTPGVIIYPEYLGYQTAYGHTDYYGDVDYGSLSLGASGYYDISSSGDTTSSIYDATDRVYLHGSSYQNNLYIDYTHANYVFIAGYITGENYSVSVTPISSYQLTDGDAADLTTSDYICPSYSGYQTAYGHTEYSADLDIGSLYMSSSGYYNVASTGNTYTYILDQSVGAWVTSSSGSYTSDLYLNVGHSYYAYVYGYTAGENYSVTVAENVSHVTDGDAADLTTSDYICPSYSGPLSDLFGKHIISCQSERGIVNYCCFQ